MSETFVVCATNQQTPTLTNVGSMLGQRRRQWTNIASTLAQYLVFAGKDLEWLHDTLNQCWFNVGSASMTPAQHYYSIMWTLFWRHRKALTQWRPFLNVVLIRSKVHACWKWPIFRGTWNIRLNFIASEFFGRQSECRFYTTGCGNKMAVSVTGPTAK